MPERLRGVSADCGGSLDRDGHGDHYQRRRRSIRPASRPCRYAVAHQTLRCEYPDFHTPASCAQAIHSQFVTPLQAPDLTSRVSNFVGIGKIHLTPQSPLRIRRGEANAVSRGEVNLAVIPITL